MPTTNQSKLSQRLTKDFEKLVKAFVRDTGRGTESARAQAAYVVGYLDSITSTTSDWKHVSPNHISSYWNGWKAARSPKKCTEKRKPRARRL